MEDILRDNLPQLLALYGHVAPYVAPLKALVLHLESLFYRFAYPFLFPAYRLTSHLVRRGLESAIDRLQASSASSSSLFGSTSAPAQLSSWLAALSSFSFESFVAALSAAILLWLSLQALNFVRRQVMWWIGVATTLATWGIVLGTGAYVYRRGVERSVDDAAWALGLLLGWAQEAATRGERVASEREWDAERYRRAGPGGAGGGRGNRFGMGMNQAAYQRPMGRGW